MNPLFDFGLSGLDAEDLDALAEDESIAVHGDTSDDTLLTDLGRTITGQYVTVIANFVRNALRAQDVERALGPLDPALSALDRLAAATNDKVLADLLVRLRVMTPHASELGGRARHLFMRDLRDWVVEFSALLDPDAAQRLRDLVEFQRESHPLLTHLGNIHGIGPRRLERLYCAGLFSPEDLVGADPADVALVTGLPHKLAVEVVAQAAEFERTWRRRVTVDLGMQARQMVEVIDVLQQRGWNDEDLVSAVETAVLQLTQALRAIRGGDGR